MTQQLSREDAFATRLRSLNEQENRAALAALRRGLGKPPGEAAEVWRYVAPWTGGLPNWRADCYCLVASLFALHPDSEWPEAEAKDYRYRPNLGDSFKRLAAEQHKKQSNNDDGGKERVSPAERRFIALLNCHPDDLADHLRHAVSLLKSKDVPVDWAELLKDIQRWDNDDRSVQRRWARAFWGSSQSNSAGDSSPTGQPQENSDDNGESDQDTDQ